MEVEISWLPITVLIRDRITRGWDAGILMLYIHDNLIHAASLSSRTEQKLHYTMLHGQDMCTQTINTVPPAPLPTLTPRTPLILPICQAMELYQMESLSIGYTERKNYMGNI